MLYRKSNGLRIAYDLVGDETAPVVYFAHALASDMGMWAEQVPAFMAAGFRVLRVDLRGHGGTIDGLRAGTKEHTQNMERSGEAQKEKI